MNVQRSRGNVGEAFRPPATALPPWLPTRKRNRLPLDAYTEPGSFFVIVATERRRPWFTRRQVADFCESALRLACEREQYELEAYCFMPDHPHVPVSNEEPHDLVRLVHGFKQETGWWFRNRYLTGGLKASPTRPRPALWQKSYYDHVLRQDEDTGEVVLYILENPVRAGLAEDIGTYPYAWSALPS